MKVQVSTASGPVLDWMVAKCEGWDAPICKNPTWAVPVYIATNDTRLYTYAPSTNWAQGGPIIARERISVVDSRAEPGEWAATVPTYSLEYGPTPLIAAMRCYVASKLGNEVEVPDELA